MRIAVWADESITIMDSKQIMVAHIDTYDARRMTSKGAIM
jgi:hypothetical protein